MKYRYISCGTAKPDDPLHHFRLIGNNNFYGQSDLIRITLPENIKLTKLQCDPYSTVEYNLTDSLLKLRDLDPKVVVRFNGKISIDETLTKLWLDNKIEPHQFYKNLGDRGYIGYIRFGFLTHEQYKFISNLKHNDYIKLWQLNKIPNPKTFKGFVPRSKYKTVYSKLYNSLKKHIKTDAYLQKVIRQHDLSTEELLDRYCEYCFSNHCDTKPDRKISEYFAYNLEEKLKWEKQIQQKIEQHKKQEENETCQK